MKEMNANIEAIVVEKNKTKMRYVFQDKEFTSKEDTLNYASQKFGGFSGVVNYFGMMDMSSYPLLKRLSEVDNDWFMENIYQPCFEEYLDSRLFTYEDNE